MKKHLLIMCLVPWFFSCAKETKEQVVAQPVAKTAEDSLTTLAGELLFLPDAAMLKGDDFVYGVARDSIALDLIEQVTPLKDDEFDLISVVVRAKIMANPRQEGWEEVIQIREVLEIPELNDERDKR